MPTTEQLIKMREAEISLPTGNDPEIRRTDDPMYKPPRQVQPPKPVIDASIAKGMRTELKAKMIMGLPNDEFKKGFNDAMQWAIELVNRYEKGEGLFQ